MSIICICKLQLNNFNCMNYLNLFKERAPW